MIFLIIILAAAILILLEKYGTPALLRQLRFHGRTDAALAEPGQKVTFYATVENHGRIPVPFVRLQLRFPVQAERAGRVTNWHDGVREWYAEMKLALKGRESCTRKLEVTLSERGVYTLGKARMSAGDILGFQENAREEDGRRLVVMPERSRDPVSAEILGGMMGDYSVRRFLLEDPILTVGFRDYTGQEPMKSISWTRTAAAGSLRVRQYDHTAERTAVVLLDVSGASSTELENCFRLARSACERLEKEKIPYSFRTNGCLPGAVGNISTLPSGLGSKHLNTILYGLGGANSVCFYSGDRLISYALDERRGSDAYLLITPENSGVSAAAIRRLEMMSGSPVYVLKGRREEIR